MVDIIGSVGPTYIVIFPSLVLPPSVLLILKESLVAVPLEILPTPFSELFFCSWGFSNQSGDGMESFQSKPGPTHLRLDQGEASQTLKTW